MVLSCRFYEQKYPDIDDVVMVNVNQIDEMGAYVRLMEYDGIEGMILLSELSRRRIRSINRLIRVGREECVVVTRVDQSKGYIDLSKRRATQEDKLKCREKYEKGKTINSILRHVAELLKFDSSQLEQLYEKTAWYFDRKTGKDNGSYEVFKRCVSDPSLLDECEISEEVRDVLLKNINHRLTNQSIKVVSKIRVYCFTYDGVNAVREALLKGLELSSTTFPFEITLVATPTYMITCVSTTSGNEIIEKMNEATKIIEQTITEKGGKFQCTKAPVVISKGHDEKKIGEGDDDEDNEENDSNEGSEDDDDDDSDEDGTKNNEGMHVIDNDGLRIDD
ncbi:hypothetical protein SNEBB_007539 [Seison nebaliae]|nr:hypothetical protein SNEBB_007539 [Seison nebaliae]